ncbi:hypothetical protein DL89DRAFT_269926 [Linderina pennispora]|uniref:ABC transporter domain-containing protein n=1 Tax=Linderina pennispora TaxID=61395 RepID=A0A1Y1W0X1_9FUNG|nr:uncharacterized protein DL89DRAFT_269926 [Linderina pennispora]ORX66886.1 hypothetical protein DL89DRAFT_269926 [Linderina pennispora]
MDIPNSVFDTIVPQITLGAIADASLTAATLLWTPKNDLGAPVQKQKRTVVALSAVCLASLAASITNAHLSSAASLLASVTVLGLTLSRRTISDGTAFLNIARAILIAVPSVPHLNFGLFAGALAHLAIAWYMFNPLTQREIRRYTRFIMGLDALALLQLCSKSDLSVNDIHDEEKVKWILHGVEKLHLDTTKAFFVLRGFLAFAWKRILSLAIIDMVIRLCAYYKGIVFAMIIGAVDQGNSVEVSGIYALCAVWGILSMSLVVDKYHQVFKSHAYWEILDVMRIKLLTIRMSQKSGQFTDRDYYETNFMDTHGMACKVDDVLSVLSQSVASFLSIRLLISKVGWHAALPAAFMVIFSIVRSLVTAKIEVLERMSKTKLRPTFRTRLDTLLQYMRTIKFYGWEQAFRGVRGYPDCLQYTPPIFWRIVDYIVTLIGSSATQLATALTVASYLRSSGTLSFTEVMIVVSSATNIAGFALQCSGVLSDLRKIFDHASAPTGEFAVVVGRVGSGKSSLLSAICSEMPLISGTGCTYGRIGYVSQKPWIMNATFRENVLFGQEFDEKFYWRVVEACALAQDVKLFPAQDLSEIGPRGINLSGGQKVRLALARAIYSRADIYVLDDLLAAVDAHVERYLIENVLVGSGMISDKTRILVTHAEHVAPLADKVITLTNGVADIVEQHPVAFTQSPSELSPEDDEDSSKDGDKGSGQFTFDPEIGVSQFQWSYMWRYLRMSGLHIVGITFAIQAAGAYATFYVDSLRLDLVMDNNRESMVQSLQKYLFMNALVNMLRVQIDMLVDWIRAVLWSARLCKHTHNEVLDMLLFMPLSQFESLPSGRISCLFNWDCYRIYFSLPCQICQQVLGAFYALNAIIHGIQRMPVLLVFVFPTVTAIFLGTRVATKARKRVDAAECSSFKFSHASTFSLVVDGQMLMRVHSVLGAYLQKSICQISTYSIATFHSNTLHQMALALHVLVAVLVESTLLFYQVWRISTLRLPSAPGEVEMVMRLAEIMISGVEKISNIGYSLGTVLPSLSKYFVYTGLPREAPSTIEGLQRLQSWPTNGTVEFRNYSMSISFSVGCNEKVGISSLTHALLRLIEPAGGSIFIDGDLRSKISIIPQDPALFVGTIRENLDPLSEFTDDEGHIEDLVDRPAQAHDVNDDSSGPWWVEDGGKNFSVGQRQLRKILVLDEATANQDCTILTIAHRLRTVMDSDRILVMDQGRVAEFDTPANLLVESIEFNESW